jgi:regulator of protease activity HflC (stomatin/prohibitin superfamily)
MILILGIVILLVACCGCLAAKKNTKLTVIGFSLISLFFMIFLLLVGVIVVEANRYIVEVFENEDGKGDPGLLALIPGFADLDI